MLLSGSLWPPGLRIVWRFMGELEARTSRTDDLEADLEAALGRLVEVAAEAGADCVLGVHVVISDEEVVACGVGGVTRPEGRSR